MTSSARGRNGLRNALWGAALDRVCGIPLSGRRESARAGGPVWAALDLRYHPGRDRHTLDVFAPAGTAHRPVVLFVHGGAWMVGDKDLFGLYRGVGRFLARNGVVAASVNYRLSPEVRHPEHVRDIARGFVWVRRHVRDFGGDPDRIILCGHSAGAHLVSLLATADGYLREEALGRASFDRAAIRGVIAVSGVYRVPSPEQFLKMLDEAIGCLRLGPKALVPPALVPFLLRHAQQLNLFRKVFGEDEAVRVEASPLTHVRPGLPPFLVLNAGAEVPGLAKMAHEFHYALRGHGNESEFRCLERYTHNTILFGLHEPGDVAGAALLEFISRRASLPAGAVTV